VTADLAGLAALGRPICAPRSAGPAGFVPAAVLAGFFLPGGLDSRFGGRGTAHRCAGCRRGRCRGCGHCGLAPTSRPLRRFRCRGVRHDFSHPRSRPARYPLSWPAWPRRGARRCCTCRGCCTCPAFVLSPLPVPWSPGAGTADADPRAVVRDDPFGPSSPRRRRPRCGLPRGLARSAIAVPTCNGAAGRRALQRVYGYGTYDVRQTCHILPELG
jgi:hypothetical protein